MVEDQQHRYAPNGPTAHTIVMEDRLLTHQDRARKWITQAFDDSQEAVIAATQDAVNKAYIAGLADGFQQGCLAESQSREAEPEDAPFEACGRGVCCMNDGHAGRCES